jgi:hypothetical protein
MQIGNFFVASIIGFVYVKFKKIEVDTENGFFFSANEAFSLGNLIYKKRLIERNQILTNDLELSVRYF